ncbi:urease accessory protein UreF [Mycolicibacterium vaccae]|uniref:Urease accessory protein UreF n=1 Tax=Mycolicibacterium vaccae ATCC 25954 TaxID=1194972 RepID=K0UUR7_MYCVA|nr:urease accessory UreF family protein [Mycolicibacterium vaccae]ANI41981.1 urease accessory protein UreF [Mycolicibacterium vaccae 95051]EJZ10516.1 urease accessory protein UreF [Mycolicibacterium vaccae ATCC 25954]MCV7063278.1 urease accessory protein UreF [Mycolicibacterium vaccae]
MPATVTDPDIALALWMQLHDSAFPTGRMVHSQGLEQWLAERPDAGHDAVGAAVLAYLANSYAPLDATIGAAAWRAGTDDRTLRELDGLLATYKLFDNARISSESAGRQLATVSRQTGLAADDRYLDAVIDGLTPGHCAVVEGALQASLGIPVRVAVLGSMRSMMASMLSAAIRLGRLGPLHSQRIQARSVPCLVDLARQACERDLDDMWSVAPTLEISGMRHETRTSRLFTT